MTQNQDDVTAQIWAKAVHTVTVQKRSLRYVADRYGVDCQALQRLASTSYTSRANSALAVPDTFRLTRPQEEAVLAHLVSYGHYSTLDQVPPSGIREAVITVVGSDVHIPMGFPSNRWVASFKRSKSFPAPQEPQSNASARRASDAIYHRFQLINDRAEDEIELTHRSAVSNMRSLLQAPDIYLPFEDEAGVLCIVRAYADIGVFIEFRDFVRLLYRTAVKAWPSFRATQLDALADCFVARTHAAIGHLVIFWPDQSSFY